MQKKYTLTFILIGLLVSGLVANDVFEQVATALRSAQARELTKYCNNNVALTILNEEGIYSKQQAEVIMKSFFTQNPPKSVSIQHRGQSAGGAQFAVAIYETGNNKFRAYIFMKNAGNGMLIHELRIERE
jgi:hypothetical protein